MLAWVVMNRRHHRPARPLFFRLSTPVFPLPPLSPLLPYSYALLSATAAPQPLCNQSVTHAFVQRTLRNSLGINSFRTLFTATEGVPQLFPFWNELRRKSQGATRHYIQVFSFQIL